MNHPIPLQHLPRKSALATISESSWKDSRSAQKMGCNSPLNMPPNQPNPESLLAVLGEASCGAGERQWALIQSLKLENVRVEEVVRVLTAANDLLRKELTMKDRQVRSLTQLLEVADAGCVWGELEPQNGKSGWRRDESLHAGDQEFTGDEGLWSRANKAGTRHQDFQSGVREGPIRGQTFGGTNRELQESSLQLAKELEETQQAVESLQMQVEDLNDWKILHESDLEQKSRQMKELNSHNKNLNAENIQLREKALELREDLDGARDASGECELLRKTVYELGQDLDKARELLLNSDESRRVENESRTDHFKRQIEQKIKHVRALETTIQGYKEYVAALEGRKQHTMGANLETQSWTSF